MSWPGGSRSIVDQVCLDIPPSMYEQECAFWAELTGWELEPRQDEFQRLVMERGPFIELVHQVNRYGAQATTHNFFLDPTGHWHLEYVWKE